MCRIQSGEEAAAERCLFTPADKSRSVDATALPVRWTRQLQAIDHDQRRLIGQAAGRTEAKPLTDRTAAHVIHQAVLSISEKQSTWRPAELTREIAAALPTDLHLHADTIGDVLDRFSDEAIRQYCLDLSRPIPDGATLRRDDRPTDKRVGRRPCLDHPGEPRPRGMTPRPG